VHENDKNRGGGSNALQSTSLTPASHGLLGHHVSTRYSSANASSAVERGPRTAVGGAARKSSSRWRRPRTRAWTGGVLRCVFVDGLDPISLIYLFYTGSKPFPSAPHQHYSNARGHTAHFAADILPSAGVLQRGRSSAGPQLAYTAGFFRTRGHVRGARDGVSAQEEIYSPRSQAGERTPLR